MKGEYDGNGIDGTTQSERCRLTSGVMQATEQRQHVRLGARDWGQAIEMYCDIETGKTDFTRVTNQRIKSVKCQLLIQFLS